ncbi:MAG: hypothetical protein JWN27_2558 [Candidatus Eremiobacteraeota bacterium]|nr:hypothetical protein [Candidatus Eremiobacteraeota bacterium]
MLHRFSKFITAAGMAAALAVGSIPKPATADTQSTLTTLAGAAALVGGLILYNNYQHKRQAANAIVGYTRNGGTVYGDGRIVMPSGQTIYPNSNGTYPWGQTAYYNPNANGYAYDTQRTGDYDTTHRHGRGHAYGYGHGNGNAYGRVNDNGNAYANGHGNGNAYGHGNGNGNDAHAQQDKHGHGHHADSHGDEHNPH